MVAWRIALGTADRVGKQQARMTVGGPPLAQHLQQRRGDRHVAVLVALAGAHMQAQAVRVDVADLQGQPLAQAQPGAVEGHEEDPVAELAHRAEQPQGLGAGQHIGQAGGARRLDDGGPGPRLVQHMAVEELQPAAVELDRAPGMGLQQLGEVDPQVLRAQVVRTAIEERGGAPHGTGIGIDGLLGHALELEGAQHAGIQGLEPGLFGGIHGGTLLGENRNRHKDVAARRVFAGRSSAAVAAPSNKGLKSEARHEPPSVTPASRWARPL